MGLSCNLEAIIPCPPYYCQLYTLQNLLKANLIHGAQLFGQDPSTMMESSLSINVHIYVFEFDPNDTAAPIKQIRQTITHYAVGF